MIRLHITTERLVLKPHTQNILVWLNTTFNNPEEDYFNGDDPPRESPEPLEVTQKLLDRILNRPPDADIIDYAIHKRDTDELIGCGMIAHINHYNRRCDLGIGLGWNRDNWGKGYPSETLQAIIAYCFNELNLNRIAQKSMSSTNTPSDCLSETVFAAKAYFASIFSRMVFSRIPTRTVW